MKPKRDPVAEFDALVLATLREIPPGDFSPDSYSVAQLAAKLPATETDTRESLARLKAKGLAKANEAAYWESKRTDGR